MKKRLLLYSTSDCTLCDAALDLLLGMDALRGHELLVIDVAGDDALFVRFGALIPVLECDGVQFPGPFEPAIVAGWLDRLSASGSTEAE